MFESHPNTHFKMVNKFWLKCFGQKGLGTGSQRLLYLNKTTNCSVVYVLWSSFRNHKSVQNIMQEKRPNSSAPFHFVASTLRSISRESLRNLRNYDSAVHMYTVSTVCKYVFVTDVKPLHLEQFCLLLHLLIFKQNLTVCQ